MGAAGSGLLDSSAAMEPPISSTPQATLLPSDAHLPGRGDGDNASRPVRGSLVSGDWGPSAFSTVSSTSMEVGAVPSPNPQP